MNERTSIAVLVPVTSRGRCPVGVADTDLFRALLPSLLATASWSDGLRYELHVGFDAGDPFYDARGRDVDLHDAWRALVGGRPFGLHLHRCIGTDHAPAHVWNQLFAEAHARGCDYFFQIGDDVVLETPGWADDFPRALKASGPIPGLGLTGPNERNNPRLLTQTFVSRAHMDVFGTYFAPAFRNWYCDDWLNDVYAPDYLVRTAPTHWAHNAGGAERYEIDGQAKSKLAGEVAHGKRRLAEWLAEKAPPS